MYEAMKPGLWSGRDDSSPTCEGSESGDSRRWHQVVQPLMDESPAGTVLLGLCCDEGVRRNQGRPGARGGPNAIRQMMANQAWQLDKPLYDAGNLHIDDQNLDAFSEQQAAKVIELLTAGHFPLLLGGGHEIAYGSWLGLSRFLTTRVDGPIGILNFDAHLDLRQDLRPSSGTPFKQIADHCAASGQPFHYACIGVSELANTRALFERAEQLDVLWLADSEITPWNLGHCHEALERFIAPLAALYLTIDLDVLPAAVAPGVSAPAARGVPLELLEALLNHAIGCADSRLRLADMAEYNPELDRDRQTARVAARLAHLILKHIP